MKYKCNFVDEDLGEWLNVDAFDPLFAAEEFADYAFQYLDMWESDIRWEGDHAVQVMDEDGNKKTYVIEVVSEPFFNALEIE